MMDPLLWSLKEAGVQLGLSACSVRRMIKRGELSQIRIGRSIRVSVKEVET